MKVKALKSRNFTEMGVIGEDSQFQGKYHRREIVN